MRLNSINDYHKAELVSINSIGDFAHQYLTQHDTATIHGLVHSVFHRCAYLQFNDILLCAALPELGESPITLLFDKTYSTLPSCLIRGAPVILSTRGLIINNTQSLCAKHARIYDSSVKPRSINQQRMLAVSQLVPQLSLPDEGLASLLSADNVQESPLLEFAKPKITALLSSLPALCACTHDQDRVAACAELQAWVRLLGAGPGLTPSGDDFVSGVLTALHINGQGASAHILWRSVAAMATASTTDISVALLEQAASGRMSQKLHLLVDELLGDIPTTPAKFSRLLSQLGETSGWDWLAGFVLAQNALLKGVESFVNPKPSVKVDFATSDFNVRNSESSPVRVH